MTRSLVRDSSALLAAVWMAAVQPVRAQGATSELLQPLAAVRAQGCAGKAAAAPPLRASLQLDEAARRMAGGQGSDAALKSAGYRAVRTFQVNMSGHASAAAVARTLAGNYCEALSNPQLTEIGVHRQGSAWWIVVAAPFAPPPASAASEVSARVLALTNQARAQPRRCGSTAFAAAPPLRANSLLDRSAAVHAQDMARHSYLSHTGRDGSEPADRITAAGYRWRSLGENVAAGQTTPDQVVRDWLRSPGHCANLMSPRFAEMGIAYAVNPASEHGMYWAQTFGRAR